MKVESGVFYSNKQNQHLIPCNKKRNPNDYSESSQANYKTLFLRGYAEFGRLFKVLLKTPDST